MPSIIRIDSLSKRYLVDHQSAGKSAGYRTLREDLGSLARMPFDRLRGAFGAKPASNGAAFSHMKRQEFWALKDISFEIQPGEVAGIIGRNGAGKSTLLKILSRITNPTTGRVTLNGRVGSLLEVGTGFHPELTGRENIYLNGSILGMSRREIDRKFDEIVDFSGVEDFLDTPVKRYSSGMQVRLAFAVAAHLDPEILIIDEVLAVGDAEFQRRCINRMRRLAESGRTLLFVSHNLELISSLCRSAYLLKAGQLHGSGPADKVVSQYLHELVLEGRAESLDSVSRTGNGKARFTRLDIQNADGQSVPAFVSGDDLRLSIDLTAYEDLRDVSVAVSMKELSGARIVSAWSDESRIRYNLPRGEHHIECQFEAVRFRPGRQIVISLWMHNESLVDQVDWARVFDVVERGTSDRSSRTDQGAYLCDFRWESPTAHAVDCTARNGSV